MLQTKLSFFLYKLRLSVQRSTGGGGVKKRRHRTEYTQPLRMRNQHVNRLDSQEERPNATATATKMGRGGDQWGPVWYTSECARKATGPGGPLAFCRLALKRSLSSFPDDSWEDGAQKVSANSAAASICEGDQRTNGLANPPPAPSMEPGHTRGVILASGTCITPRMDDSRRKLLGTVDYIGAIHTLLEHWRLWKQLR